MRIWMAVLGLACAFGAQAAPRIAVTDMAFERQVEQYIHTVSAQANYNAGVYHASGSASYNEMEQRYSYIEQGELRKFSGDIKGEILRSGLFELVQGTPYTAAATQDVYDIIKRIKAGNFKGADYVLFGTVSDIDFRQDVNEIAHTDTASSVLSLTLVGDFSVIDTKTFKIIAAFTAMGEGQDTKLANGRDVRINAARGRVVRDVSKSIGEDVARQLREQLRGEVEYTGQPPVPGNRLPPDQPATILR